MSPDDYGWDGWDDAAPTIGAIGCAMCIAAVLVAFAAAYGAVRLGLWLIGRA